MGSVNYFLGVPQYFVKDPLELFDKIKEIHPTYLVVVPRFLEKIHQQIFRRLQSRGVFSRLCFRCLLALRGIPSKWLGQLTDRLFAARLRAAIWGREMRFLISGTAPVDAEILRFFDRLGVPTYEVYGLSEIGFLISMNQPGAKRYGSVGRPLEHVQVRIAEDNEVLAKTTAALESYWRQSGDDLFDAAGYLKTGDLGEIRQGFLYITGRKKDIIKTSTGQRISPVAVERVYRQIAGIDEIVVIGNGRRYLTALVTPEEQFRSGVAGSGDSFESYLQKEIEKRRRELPRTRRIQRFTILPNPLSVSEGEVTPTLKVRRTIIEEKYRELIDLMYQEDEP